MHFIRHAWNEPRELTNKAVHGVSQNSWSTRKPKLVLSRATTDCAAHALGSTAVQLYICAAQNPLFMRFR